MPEPIMQILISVAIFVVTGIIGVVGINALRVLKAVTTSMPQIIESLSIISKGMTAHRQTSKLLARSLSMVCISMKNNGFNSTIDDGLDFARQAEACVDGSADIMAEAAMKVGD